MRWSTSIILLADGDEEVPRTVKEFMAVVPDYIVLQAATVQEARRDPDRPAQR